MVAITTEGPERGRIIARSNIPTSEKTGEGNIGSGMYLTSNGYK
jgi:hypothetical protein